MYISEMHNLVTSDHSEL